MALALVYFVNNLDHILENEDSYFGVPDTLISIILSGGSVLFGILTGINQWREVIRARYRATPLHCAAEEGNLEEVKHQLQKSYQDLDVRNKSGKTALNLAADKGHTQVVKTLVEAGAAKDIQDEDGCTAMIWAARRRHVDVLKILIHAKASLDLQASKKWNPNRCGEGSSPLIISSMRGMTEGVQALVDAGAQTELRDKNGNTAIIHAARLGNWQIVDVLIEAGASLDVIGRLFFCTHFTPFMFPQFPEN